MPITIKRFEELDLTIFKATGVLQQKEQLKTLQSFYEGSPTTLLLWDLREVTKGMSTYDEVEELLSYVKKKARLRKGGKTAIVTSTDISYGWGRMTASLATAKSIPLQIQVFRSIKEAAKWLDVNCPEEII